MNKFIGSIGTGEVNLGRRWDKQQNQWGLKLPATTSWPREALSADQYLLNEEKKKTPSDYSIGTKPKFPFLSFFPLSSSGPWKGSSCLPVPPGLLGGLRERKLIEKRTLKPSSEMQDERWFCWSEMWAMEQPSLPSSNGFLSAWRHFLSLRPTDRHLQLHIYGSKWSSACSLWYVNIYATCRGRLQQCMNFGVCN